MLIADDTYYECPSCSAVYSKMNLMSGNTFSATYYSDCKRDAPHLPDSPRITQCVDCQEIFWLDALAKVEKVNIDMTKVRQADFLSIEGLNETLRIRAYQTENQKQNLRMQLLWAYHDEFRAGRIQHEDLKCNPLYIKNIADLMIGLDPNEASKGLLLAELYRFIGMFDISMKTSKPYLGETDFYVADTSYDLASKQLSAPFRIERT